MQLKQFISLLFIGITLMGCQKKIDSSVLQEIITVNDIGIELRVEKDKGCEIERITDGKGNKPYLKISVSDECSIRGKTEIDIEQPYRLSVTIKNDGANPLFLYSFWKGLVTSRRNFTLAGENGNPPLSGTQEVTSEWTTFDEIFPGTGRGGRFYAEYPI
jgi:hypothetical protein